MLLGNINNDFSSSQNAKQRGKMIASIYRVVKKVDKFTVFMAATPTSNQPVALKLYLIHKSLPIDLQMMRMKGESY